MEDKEKKSQEDMVKEAVEEAKKEAEASKDEAEEAKTEEVSEEQEAGTEDQTEEKASKKFFGKKDKKDKKDEKIEELTDRLTRQMAEFDNFRKRTEKEKSQMYEVGAKDIIEKILPVVDNFERGLDAVPEEKKEDLLKKLLEHYRIPFQSFSQAHLERTAVYQIIVKQYTAKRRPIPQGR